MDYGHKDRDQFSLENLLNFHKQNDSLEILPPEIRQIDNQSNHLIKSINDIHQRDIYSFIILIQELFYDSNNVQPKSDPNNNHNFNNIKQNKKKP